MFQADPRSVSMVRLVMVKVKVALTRLTKVKAPLILLI